MFPKQRRINLHFLTSRRRVTTLFGFGSLFLPVFEFSMLCGLFILIVMHWAEEEMLAALPDAQPKHAQRSEACEIGRRFGNGRPHDVETPAFKPLSATFAHVGHE